MIDEIIRQKFHILNVYHKANKAIVLPPFNGHYTYVLSCAYFIKNDQDALVTQLPGIEVNAYESLHLRSMRMHLKDIKVKQSQQILTLIELIKREIEQCPHLKHKKKIN